MSHLRKAVLGRNVKRTGLSQNNQPDFAPIKWSQYFDEEMLKTTTKGTFHLYIKGNNTGPAIVCLHGGGYSGLTWALFAVEITNAIECQVVAIDLRGHGNTKTNDDGDLSLETMARDVVEILEKMYEDTPIILVGHSMGGAVAVECSYLLQSIAGLSVIDVVEGTALDALSSMQSILRGRPATFKSIQHAIQWCYKGGQTHNLDAAKVSMPGQIVNLQTGVLASNECDLAKVDEIQVELSQTHPFKHVFNPASIEEEPDDENNCVDCGKPPLPKAPKAATDNFALPADTGPKYCWRIDLSKTEKFWNGWFSGLSQKFLDIRIPKLLLLANIHGLDTKLTVGQMQGKFQLQVMSKSGHAIHEDQPHNVAEIIGGYLVKQKLATPKGEMICHLPGC